MGYLYEIATTIPAFAKPAYYDAHPPKRTAEPATAAFGPDRQQHLVFWEPDEVLHDMPVLYYDVTKVKRGYYEVRFTPLCEKPSQVPQYTITSRYIKMLKETIDRHPEYWLWSHRRWKRTRPEGMELHSYTLLSSKSEKQ